ncbi:unnamed protein product [Mycena citricolor]|uniref:Uncharacterized protein n=1 Tax=Mycena citricolor TaxID=2018698 RepID=A0AAD2HY54_9AGAR|nr:unnamed protein product [Mycena citricolor]
MSSTYVLLQYGTDAFNARFVDLEGRPAFSVGPVPHSPNLVVKLGREAEWTQHHPGTMGPTRYFYFGPYVAVQSSVYGAGTPTPSTGYLCLRQQPELDTHDLSEEAEDRRKPVSIAASPASRGASRTRPGADYLQITIFYFAERKGIQVEGVPDEDGGACCLRTSSFSPRSTPMPSLSASADALTYVRLPSDKSVGPSRWPGLLLHPCFLSFVLAPPVAWKPLTTHTQLTDGRTVFAVWETAAATDDFDGRLTLKHAGLAFVTEIMATLTINRMSGALGW